MNILQQIDQDLKESLLARDEITTSTLRSVKSALTYASVEDKSKGGDGNLNEEQISEVLAKESKKRRDSAEAFTSGGSLDRAERELAEKKIIDGYLPEPLSDEEISKLVDDAISQLDSPDMKSMGQIISTVRSAAGSGADGAKIAKLVRERLAQ